MNFLHAFPSLGRCIRFLAIISVFLGSTPVLPAAPAWTTNYAAAVAQAKKEHKKILLDFTGSDWCSWCIKLEKDVYEKPEFATYAAKNLVLVTLDYPQLTKLSPALQTQNDALKAKYKISAYPTTILLDENEKIVTTIVGYVEGGPQAFIAALDKRSAVALLNSARGKFVAKDYDGAIADYTQAIAIDPQSAPIYYVRGLTKEMKRDDAGAVADYKRALQLDPKNVEANRALGWILAASANSAVRNGQQAVLYAAKACELSNWTDANALDNLAAATAEAGDFTDAIKWETKYLTMPVDKLASDGGRQRLALYQQGKPYHEPAK